MDDGTVQHSTPRIENIPHAMDFYSESHRIAQVFAPDARIGPGLRRDDVLWVAKLPNAGKPAYVLAAALA
ncbi:MAG: hypothetical protein ACR2O4_09220 [Hyphomicrobiaceae bacterium]